MASAFDRRVELRTVAAGDADAAALNDELNAEAQRRYGSGHDFGPAIPLSDHDPPLEVILVAYAGESPAGLATLRRLDAGTAEIKRMVVAADHRGRGIGRLLLEDLERRAREWGCSTVKLDSAGLLTEAIDLYRSAGYREIPRYNDNPHAEIWFEKGLAD